MTTQKMNNITSVIDMNMSKLQDVAISYDIGEHKSRCYCPFPSHERLMELVNCVRDICFPGYFEYVEEENATHKIRDCFYRIHRILPEQIYFGMTFCKGESTHIRDKSRQMTIDFINAIPHIKHLLHTDVEATLQNDPAANDVNEVILCYPTIRAMLHHRIAHQLHNQRIPILPRMISEIAHADTGIDIHPAAQIGRYFTIDHGTGVVVGQTCIIGDHVCIYQGVTLGAKNFSFDDRGNPMDIPRHPILEDHVTVYSNASILGRVTIGKHSVIGGNVWVTTNIPAHSRVVQQRAVSTTFSDGAGI